MLPRHYRFVLILLAAMAIPAANVLAMGFALGKSKEELGLGYDVKVTQHGTGRVTIVFTLKDEGSLKPLTAVDLHIPAKKRNEDGGRYSDLSVAVNLSAEDGKKVARVHLLRELADRAEIQLKTRHLDGVASPLTWYYHPIVVAEYLPGSTAYKPENKVSGEQQAHTPPDIFARIWNLPESHVAVSTMGPNGVAIDPTANVVLNEQGKAGNCLDDDHAPEPLLTVIDESLFEEPTFKTFIALLDNYTAAERRPEVTFEDSSHSHWQEVGAFLDAVFGTVPMQTAVAHVQSKLAPGASAEEIRATVRRLWFEPYTNRYRDDQPFCVGFEHVFVGEDESNSSGAPRCEDRVGGYHSWIKFYLEQKAGKTNYLGYDYPEGDVAAALADHKVATMLMRWSPTAEEDGAHGNDLLKKPGGFFIGTKPELEIAFGMLAHYAQKAGAYDNVPGKENHHRVKLGTNYFDLVMHPQTLKPSQRGEPTKRGDHIRTLYPKFRGSENPSDTPLPKVDLPTQPHNDAAIQILSALPNPAAEGDVGEWVEIRNVSGTELDLVGWSLKDQLGRTKSIGGTLGSMQSMRIPLDRADSNSMMLKNGEGWILLFQNDVRRAAVKYSGPRSDQIIQFGGK